MSDASEARVVNDENLDLWHLLVRTSLVTSKARDRELSKHGISAAISSVLFTIASQEGYATPGSLSRQLLREPHTVSEQLSRMERRGLVRKVRERGKNQIRVEITPAGYEAFRKSGRERESIDEFMSVLSSDERKGLKVALSKIFDRAAQQLGTTI